MVDRSRIVALGFVACSIMGPAFAKDLTFDDRVRAQRAIEQVYWGRRVWPKENAAPKPSLAEVMPDAAIRAKVERYLKESSALDALWQRPVTHDQLQAELDRLVRETHDGAMLSQIFAALGNDPDVIAECFARPVLVDRLIRDWYAQDNRFQGALRQRAQAARVACADTACMKTMDGTYAERAYGREIESDHLLADRIVRLEPTELSSVRATFTAPLGRLGDIEETWDAFTVRAVTAESADGFTTAAVTWPKESFNTWWPAKSASLTAEIAEPAGSYTMPAAPLTGCTPNTWSPTYLGAPDARTGHTAVWTGTEMIIWGGGAPVGGRYNPATNSWVQVSAGAGTPAPRTGHTAVWTGTEMIVWGGRATDSAQTSLADGARYNPSTDTWTPLPSLDAPNARYAHAAAWTGSLMVVWGGSGGSVGVGGGRYNPSNNTWSATTISGAPGLRGGLTAVWTGSEVIFWGGANGSGPVSTGAKYNPNTDTWLSTANTGIPSARSNHTAVWTGSEMIVWGGDTGATGVTNTGARYNPATNDWVATSTAPPAPLARRNHTAVWTGTRMIVWGGSTGSPTNSGAVYDPVGNGWVVTPGGASNPAARELHTAVWTGSEMLIWGGTGTALGPASLLNTGARFSLASNSWVPISNGSFVPSARGEHTAVWTGSEMIVWGGDGAAGYFNTGARYDMTTNTWTATSTGTSVPTARARHTAVWTGTKMIVWGGYDGFNTVGTGGRYDPFTDTWATMAVTGAPFQRQYHSSIWTGSLMIVWGGGDSALNPFNTGGRYDPFANAWTPTTTTNAPVAREAHAAAFNGGDAMMIWGGADATLFGVNSGAIYNVPGNSWVPIFAGPNVPSPRFWPAAAFTGSELLIWGGGGTTDVTGGRYFPPTNQWSSISTAGAPTARELMGSVWTGDKLVVFGGRFVANDPIINNTGGRFSPATNLWSSTSLSGSVPSARYAHTAVWTGSVMITWGGFPLTASGGIYCPDACASPTTYYLDADGDGYGTTLSQVQACSQPAGYSALSTDCNDANGNIHPEAAEACNGVDMNCDGVADSAVPPEINFGTIVRLGSFSARYPWTSLPGVTYEAVRGTFSGAVVDTDPNHSCLQNSTTSTFWDDLNYPAIPTFWWFLVRAENSCGKGTLGFATNHTTPTTERTSLVCP